MKIRTLSIRTLSISATLLGCWSISAAALNEAGQRNAKLLASGGPTAVARAAKDMFETAATDPELLDIAAQQLSEFHLKNPRVREYADATAWLCKALGTSGNGRYKTLLEQVSKAKINRKTRKYCDQSADNLPDESANSFQPGSVDLARYRDAG